MIKAESIFHFILFVLFLESRALSNETPKVTKNYYSKAHFAFVVHNDKKLGFTNAGGSTILLDAGKFINQSLSLGLRSVATGTSNYHAEFYRLSTGALFGYHPDNLWTFHCSISQFYESYYDKEALMNSNITASNRYKGIQFISGFERAIHIIPYVFRLSWGVFWTYHQGISLNRGNSGLHDVPPARGISGLAKGLNISFEFNI